MPVRIASELGRKEFVLVSLVAGEEGPVAFPTAKGSGAVTSFSQADGFLRDRRAGVRARCRQPRARDADRQTRARCPTSSSWAATASRSTSCSARWPSAGSRARTIAVGSQGGVAAAERGECDLAPVHLVDPASGDYNAHLLRAGLALVKGWQRMQGFVFRPDDARFAGRDARRTRSKPRSPTGSA